MMLLSAIAVFLSVGLTTPLVLPALSKPKAKPMARDAVTEPTGPMVRSHCVPLAEPYNATNPDTWPLDNSTFSESSLMEADQLLTNISLVMDYIVRKHNCLRSKAPATNMLKVVWNVEAALQAQEWTDLCSYNHNSAQNRTTSRFVCGQNIGYMDDIPVSWNRMINAWYNEVNDYVPGEEATTNALYGHYTQIDWAKTHQVGCAYKRCSGIGGTFHYYTCHYCPSGNELVNGVKQAPYVRGEPCAACPNNCNEGLCTNSCEWQDRYNNCAELNRTNRICRLNNGLSRNCQATCKCAGKIY